MSEKEYTLPETVKSPHTNPETMLLCEAIAGLYEEIETLKKGEE